MAPTFAQLSDDPNRLLAALIARKLIIHRGEHGQPLIGEDGAVLLKRDSGADYPVWVKVDDDIPFVEFHISQLLYANNIEYQSEWGDMIPEEPREQIRALLVAAVEGEVPALKGLKLAHQKGRHSEMDLSKFLDPEVKASYPIYTYPELARFLILPLFREIRAELGALDEDSLPHQTKDLRRNVVKLRNYVDLFSKAYPLTEEGVDLWQLYRWGRQQGDTTNRRPIWGLDQVYETMGKFKDFYDKRVTQAVLRGLPEVTYENVDNVDNVDIADLKPIRELLLFARDQHLWFVQNYDLEDYLSHPKIPLNPKETATDRKDSSQFWKGFRAVPLASFSGLETIALMILHDLDKAADEAEAFLAIQGLGEDLNDRRFHDFRKRIRTILKVSGYFCQIDGSCGQEEATGTKAILDKVEDAQGEINDMIMVFHAQSTQATPSPAEIKVAIEARWNEIRAWLDSDDTKLHDAIREYQFQIETQLGRLYGESSSK